MIKELPGQTAEITAEETYGETAMEALRAGIRIYREPAIEDGTPYLWLSPGSEQVAGGRCGGIAYRRAAMVPLRAWSEPTEEQLLLLCCGDLAAAQPGLTISIIRIPDSVLQPLLGASETTLAELGGKTVRTAEAEQACDRALAQLGGFLTSREDLVVQGIYAQTGGLRTATTQPSPDGIVFTGMHVDRWHQGRYGCREHAQLSINLAPRDRYLLFINVPVDQLAGQFGEPVGGRLSIPRDFAKRCGNYPVVRMRVRPGEAYIAPTENLIHDVSLEGSGLPDVCFTMRGRFRLPGAPAPNV